METNRISTNFTLAMALVALTLAFCLTISPAFPASPPPKLKSSAAQKAKKKQKHKIAKASHKKNRRR